MTRVYDRTTLEEYLDDVDLTLLIIIGPPGTNADLIHDRAEEKIAEEWRVCLLLEDTSLLESSERTRWGLGDQRYVSLGIGNGDERVAARKGASGELLRQDGQASILRIRQAFARGDQV